jgi:hypothetical protein
VEDIRAFSVSVMVDDVRDQIIDRAYGFRRWRELISPPDHAEPDLAARVVARRVLRRAFESHGSMSVVPSLAAVVAVEARVDRGAIDRAASEHFGLLKFRNGKRRAAHHQKAIRASVGDAVAVLVGESVEGDRPLRADLHLDAPAHELVGETIDNLFHLGLALADRLSGFQS